MPGAGTDRTREWIEGGPVIVLVEPQLGENIGAAARAMANFGLTRLRLVKPRDGWPSAQARRSASGADRVIDEAKLFDTLEAAIADCTYVLATTARDHHQAKPVIGAAEAAAEMAPRIAAGETVAVVFGRERNGLENEEVALADKIVTLPVNPAFASLNLSQAVLVIAYEWFTLATGGKLPFEMRQRSVSAPREQLIAFFEGLERELARVEFFRPPEKRETMVVNLRNVIHRMQPTQQDVQTLHGVIMALAQGRKGPAKGGILDGAEAELLRELLAGHGDARASSEHAPVRGLARLLRRNPTDAERALWEALVKDRRFAGRFKRQVPVGPHIADFVSFPLRTLIEIVPARDTEAGAKSRATKRSWFTARGYRVIDVVDREIEADDAGVLDRLAAELALAQPESKG